VLVANCDPYSYAGPVPLHVAPRARFELGIDFVAPVRVRARDVPRLVRYLVRGREQDGVGGLLTGHDLDRIVVRCDRPLPLQADGEDLGDVEEVVFEAERDAVDVLV
jgi:diacylglycerol kinase family enzyme